MGKPWTTWAQSTLMLDDCEGPINSELPTRKLREGQQEKKDGETVVSLWKRDRGQVSALEL